MTSTTSSNVVKALKTIFSRHGIPAVFMSDNGPQYVSEEVKRFATSYGFRHITSSPYYPKSNGLAERTVKTVKSLIRNTNDPYMALLSYRATALPWCGLSPAELLMGRKLRTDIPQVPSTFVPEWRYLTDFRRSDARLKEKEKSEYDKRHRTRPLPELPTNTSVWVNTHDPGNSCTT